MLQQIGLGLVAGGSCVLQDLQLGAEVREEPVVDPTLPVRADQQPHTLERDRGLRLRQRAMGIQHTSLGGAGARRGGVQRRDAGAEGGLHPGVEVG
ncbi:hypothetical protein ABT263_21220 [Kitasatospora sp. NPDC001603]|uniref:hypothetical protein n=1 Tax=Kitasatospora sp. NPDC001603 TaxID=3154388 RepID=UPI00332C1882